MKKILTLALVGAMLAATGITAFAETTNVSYNVDPSYTVSIPASVTLGDADVTADITASDVILEDGKQIKVELTSASNTASGSTFNAKNGDSAVTYTITGDSHMWNIRERQILGFQILTVRIIGHGKQLLYAFGDVDGRHR